MLIISALTNAAEAYAAHKPSSVVSLLCEEETIPSFAGLDDHQHIKLYVDSESCAQSLNAAARERAKEIIAFARGNESKENVLIHCQRGVARSTAAAYIMMCVNDPTRPESEIANNLRQAAPHADPCPLIVEYADEILGRDGRMIEAIEDLPPPCTALSAPIVTLPLGA